MNKRLLDKVESLSIDLNETQVQQFIKFYEMLVEWNKVMNLTGITEYDEVMRRWGVIDALRKKGAKEGDTVRIVDMEFDFVE